MVRSDFMHPIADSDMQDPRILWAEFDEIQSRLSDEVLRVLSPLKGDRIASPMDLAFAIEELRDVIDELSLLKNKVIPSELFAGACCECHYAIMWEDRGLRLAYSEPHEADGKVRECLICASCAEGDPAIQPLSPESAVVAYEFSRGSQIVPPSSVDDPPS